MSDQSDKTDPTNRFDEDLVIGGDRPLSIPGELPVLPLRDTVLFPNSFMPLAVAREASVRLIDEATTSGRMIGVFTQREASVEEPLLEDLYPIGTATHIHKMFKLPDGSLRLIVQGLARICGARSLPRTKACAKKIISRSTPCSATSRAISSRSCRSRRYCPTTCRRCRPTLPTRGSSPTSSPRASRPSGRR